MTISEQIEALLFQSANRGDAAVVITFSNNRRLKIFRELGHYGIKHYTIPRKLFVQEVLERKPK